MDKIHYNYDGTRTYCGIPFIVDCNFHYEEHPKVTSRGGYDCGWGKATCEICIKMKKDYNLFELTQFENQVSKKQSRFMYPQPKILVLKEQVEEAIKQGLYFPGGRSFISQQPGNRIGEYSNNMIRVLHSDHTLTDEYSIQEAWYLSTEKAYVTRLYKKMPEQWLLWIEKDRVLSRVLRTNCYPFEQASNSEFEEVKECLKKLDKIFHNS